MARTIQLTPDQEALVERLMQSARYASATDLVTDALTQLEDDLRGMADEETYLLAMLDAEAARPRSPSIPADEVFAEIRAKIAATEKRQAAE